MRILSHRNRCNHIGQDFQDTWTTLSFTTIVKRVNDKDETGLGGKERADGMKEESVFQRMRFQIRVVEKTVFHSTPKRGGRF